MICLALTEQQRNPRAFMQIWKVRHWYWMAGMRVFHVTSTLLVRAFLFDNVWDALSSFLGRDEDGDGWLYNHLPSHPQHGNVAITMRPITARPEDLSAAGRRQRQLCLEVGPEDALKDVTLEMQVRHLCPTLSAVQNFGWVKISNTNIYNCTYIVCMKPVVEYDAFMGTRIEILDDMFLFVWTFNLSCIW